MSDNTAAQAVLTALGYEPTHRAASARLFADWRLQAGDIVTVTSGSGTSQESYTVPIYNLEMTWKGSPIVEVDTTGQKERAPLPALSRRSYGAQSATNQTLDGITARLNNQGNKIGLVVEETSGGNVIRAAEIAAAINANGSAAYINADHIYITGTTVLSGVLDIQNGGLRVQDPMNVSGGDLTVTHSGATVSSTNFSLYSGGTITFNGSTPGSVYAVGADDVSTMIIKAAVSGNTLQLWKRGDNTSGSPTITFSKATTLDDAWSSGTYTVTASQNSTTVGTKSTTVYLSASGGGTAYSNFDVIVYHDQVTGGNEAVSNKIYLVDVPASNRVEARWGSSTGTAYAAASYTGGSVPPSTHIQISGPPSYSPSYTGGGTQLTSWPSVVRQAVNNNGYLYFDAWLTDNTSDKKRYYIKFG